MSKRAVILLGAIGALAILSLGLYYLVLSNVEPFDYHLKRGIEFEQQGENIKAIDEYREAVKYDPGSEEAHTRLGDLLLYVGDLDAAEYHLIKALQIYEDSPLANLGLGRVYMERGQLELARIYINSAFVKGREMPQVLMHWAKLMDKLGKPDSAEIFFKRAVEKATYKAPLANTLANFYVKTDRIDSAYAYFEYAAELDSDYVTAKVNLANLKLASGDTATAVNDYISILSTNPDLADVAYNLAVVYFRRQEYGLALQYAEKAVAIDSTYQPALRLVGMLKK
jgi:tetratricopeptide (TPR) repeat protein